MRKLAPISLLLALGLLLTGLPRTAGAQSSPGGVSSGLTLWLKADAGVETNANGTSVTAWRDQSPNHFDVTQSDMTVTAARVPNVLNGLPVLRFNGNNYLSRPSGIGLSGAPPVTAFIYANILNTGEKYLLYFGSATGASLSRIGFASDSSIRYNGGNVIWANDPLQGGFHLGTWRRKTGDSTLGACVFFRDGLAATQTSAGSPAKTLNVDGAGDLLVGISHTGSAGGPLGMPIQGDIAEIVLYERELSDTERLAVEAYLKNKYVPGTRIYTRGLPYAFPRTAITTQSLTNVVLGAQDGTGKLTVNNVSFRAGVGAQAFSFVTTPTLGRVFNANEFATFTLAFRPRAVGNYQTTLTLKMTLKPDAGTVTGTSQTLAYLLTGTGIQYAPGFIPGITATASSTQSTDYPVDTVNNLGMSDSTSTLVGAKTALHDINLVNMWCTPQNSPIQSSWIQFDLGQVHKLGEMWIWNHNEIGTNGPPYKTWVGHGIRECKVSYATDAAGPFTLLGVYTFARSNTPQADSAAARAATPPCAATNQDGSGLPVNFGGATARYVKFEVISNWDGTTSGQVGLSEVRFYEYVPPPNALRHWGLFD